MRSLRAPQSVSAALLLTFAAVAADQFFAPALNTSSPLWAIFAGLLLVWRRGELPSEQGSLRFSASFSPIRIALFLAAHAALVLTVLGFASLLLAPAARFAPAGWLFAALKLSVLAPTLLLFPFDRSRTLARIYAREAFAALLVLFTFFPSRAMEALWPWYGQLLGRSVYLFARLFVPALTYQPALTPTLSGSDLDVTILYACSGINGLELFDILFSLVVFCDWNRLQKRRALLAYFGGLVAMLVTNALRISSLIVLGNHGFVDFVARFHISAGWIFFTVVFLLYLALIYRRIIASPVPAIAQPLPFAEVVGSPAAE